MWYLFGEVLLDRITGSVRSARASVYFSGELPDKAIVRTAFGLTDKIGLDFYTDLPAPICNIDEYVAQPSGEILEFPEGSPIGPSARVVRLLTQEITARDSIRLWFWKNRYPELDFGAELGRRLDAVVQYLELQRLDFPEIDLYFRYYE